MTDDLQILWFSACDAMAGAQGAEDADAELKRFVDLARDDLAGRARVISLLTEALDAGCPWEALAYSFHALRWPELLAAVEERRAAWIASPRAQNIWSHLREAFNRDWEDRDMFPSLGN
jgi:hypothetical protein